MAKDSQAEEQAALVAMRAGDAAAFTNLAERYRRQLQVHCYRMLGSLEDAEDLVQETLLRAWRGRAEFEGASLFRTWLYRIATNLCLNSLERLPRRVLPNQVTPPAADPRVPLPPPSDLPWLQPYPDGLLEGIAEGSAEPGEIIVARETIELAFLAAIQLLPPRQRAALILRDVLGWSAKETASQLETSVASANSALQRARATLKEHLPDRHKWARSSDPTEDERALLQRYIDAVEREDFEAFALLLRDDARLLMPPFEAWYQGRDAIVTFMKGFASAFDGHTRLVPTGANMQPALAFYLQRPGDSEHRALSLNVFKFEDGALVEIVAFDADIFPAFGLPTAL
ncbi:MAG TPA: sigma-70 family RNA polymerase sigma factor [Actinomycetota bacterium]|nr:sigma-70 family RNA polymerase sigma factor [Actinomycetota bacterium]